VTGYMPDLYVATVLNINYFQTNIQQTWNVR